MIKLFWVLPLCLSLTLASACDDTGAAPSAAGTPPGGSGTAGATGGVTGGGGGLGPGGSDGGLDSGVVADAGIPDGGGVDGSSAASPPPEIQQDATYSVTKSTHVYGQGLSHTDWGGPVASTVDLELDVYEPTDAPPGRPAVVLIHGGSFKGGSKTQEHLVAFAEHFAGRGWVALSINYRVASNRGTVPKDWADFVTTNVPEVLREQANAMYPAGRDTKAALRWLSSQADTYQVDTDYVTAIGGSAGSYLAIMLGVTNPADFRDELTLEQDATLASTHLNEGAAVHTIIDHWGGTSLLEILEMLDGVSRYDATDAPVSIVHGTDDPTVPFVEAEKLRDAYIATGVPYAFHPREGARHGIWGEIVDGMSLQELAFAFVVEQQGLTVLP